MIILPPLSYAYDALVPYIDAQTMEIHHGKHHQTYVDKYNSVIEKYPELSTLIIEDVLKKLSTLSIDEKDKKAIQNFGGGVLNHNLFWSIIGPKKNVDDQLTKRITNTFGSIEIFKKQFEEIANTHFGSGWTWLVEDEKNMLQIYALPNQDSPLSLGHTPILTLDVWEHAYYLHYQNRRAEYVHNWWNVCTRLA